MSRKKIAVLVGSLRKESYNRKLANEIIKLAPESLKLEIVEIGKLPLYNEDSEVNTPVEWSEFRKKIGDADGYLFFTPEYNRNTSAALKNSLDVGSRPYGQNKWSGKPGGIISSSMGQQGGILGNHGLRQSMVFLDVFMMQQPEAYIGSTHELFDEQGNLTNERTRSFLKNWIDAFAEWVNKF